MTGYAAASADSPRGRLALELRSVNARFLDLQSRQSLLSVDHRPAQRIAGRARQLLEYHGAQEVARPLVIGVGLTIELKDDISNPFDV